MNNKGVYASGGTKDEREDGTVDLGAVVHLHFPRSRWSGDVSNAWRSVLLGGRGSRARDMNVQGIFILLVEIPGVPFCILEESFRDEPIFVGVLKSGVKEIPMRQSRLGAAHKLGGR